MTKTSSPTRRHVVLIVLMLVLVWLASVVAATPRLGSNCIACHETSTGPAPVPPPPADTRMPPLWEMTEDITPEIVTPTPQPPLRKRPSRNQYRQHQQP